MKNQARFYTVLLAVLVVFCVLAFAVPFIKNGVFWISFVFALLAIAAQIYTLPKAFREGSSVKSKFYGFPIAKLSVLYLTVQLLLSLVCMAAAKWIPGWVCVVVNVLLVAFAVVGFVSADTMRDEIQRQDGELSRNVSVMRALQSKMGTLADRCTDPEAALAVKKADEALRYSDPVSSAALSEIEVELSAVVDELQQAVVDDDKAGILSLCSRMEITLAERNRLCKLSK